jgi:hypothetical protein
MTALGYHPQHCHPEQADRQGIRSEGSPRYDLDAEQRCLDHADPSLIHFSGHQVYQNPGLPSPVLRPKNTRKNLIVPIIAVSLTPYIWNF